MSIIHVTLSTHSCCDLDLDLDSVDKDLLARIHGFDGLGVRILDNAALRLERGRELTCAAREVLREDRKLLNLGGVRGAALAVGVGGLDGRANGGDGVGALDCA